MLFRSLSAILGLSAVALTTSGVIKALLFAAAVLVACLIGFQIFRSMTNGTIVKPGEPENAAATPVPEEPTVPPDTAGDIPASGQNADETPDKPAGL